MAYREKAFSVTRDVKWKFLKPKWFRTPPKPLEIVLAVKKKKIKKEKNF